MNGDAILVVDDSAPNRMILSEHLRRLGFSVIECTDGIFALEKLRGAERSSIIAIISDIMMAEMDGLELLREIRADQDLTKLPFILVTALAEKESVYEAAHLAVDGYILKPFTSQKISEKLQEILPDHPLMTKKAS
jgi:two-component system chemotaxis response regulator CheY